jgi:hypothetical protein
MTRAARVPLYQRLPEIYRIKDAEQQPTDQLRAYLALVEDAFGAIHENIESLYHDLFIETCDDWVIPYIGDLLGTTHLSGEPWTLRADVADTIALRRRKGTLGAIELLAYNLTGWGVHSVELRENLVWNQHLNHQRPDDGGLPPYRDSGPGDPNPKMKLQTVIRGGTTTLRDPALLALLGTPFDPFAHTADVRPPANGSIRYNLPNLAIFLWRLVSYRVRVTRPIVSPPAVGSNFVVDDTKVGVETRTRYDTRPLALRIVRFRINRVDRPYLSDEKKRESLRLFNTNLIALNDERRTATGGLDNNRVTPSISLIDETPGPIPTERLTSGSPAGVPSAYVAINTYDVALKDLSELPLSDVGLQLHFPQGEFSGESFPAAEGQLRPWLIRGANLCAWEINLKPPIAEKEIVIDPVTGRFMIGVDTNVRAQALVDNLLVTYTYGAVGSVGAHPVSRPDIGTAGVRWVTPLGPLDVPTGVTPFPSLTAALVGVSTAGTTPIVIEIQDSLPHALDLNHASLTADTKVESGERSLMLNRPLVIRAADNQRPIIELAQPLRFRPANVASPTNNTAEQKLFDAAMSKLTVRLEGLYLTRGQPFTLTNPLIARAAVNRLEILDCTLDPAGYKNVHGDRENVLTSMKLNGSYGFPGGAELNAFNQIPEIILSKTISGPLLIDNVYSLNIANSIIDAGQGVNDPNETFAVTSATAPVNGWGPPASVRGVTILGRMRVESIDGTGAIWVHGLQVFDNQKGCIGFSYFSNETKSGVALDVLPQNHDCVKGTEAKLRFKSEFFGDPAYCQLTGSTDVRIREQGPDGDEMGAFGFLREAHKWRNLQIRFREFMPVGTRPLLIPVT